MAWVESKSTDKLEMVTEMVNKLKTSLPEEKLNKVKTMGITWRNLEHGCNGSLLACPEFYMEFFE